MDKPADFKITDCGDYFTIENVKAKDFDNFHTHLNKKRRQKDSKKTCRLLIELICEKTVPDSRYLRTSAKRLSRDRKYIDTIIHKEKKDRDKQRFFKVNNGRF